MLPPFCRLRSLPRIARASSAPFQGHASHRKNPDQALRTAGTSRPRCPDRRRQRRRWPRQKSRRSSPEAFVLVLPLALDPPSASAEDDHHREDDLISASQLCANAWLAFFKFQACCLLPVAQPFDKNNALLILKDSLFKGCLFLPVTRVRERYALSQNRNKSIRPGRQKIGNVAGTQQCHRVFKSEKLRRWFFLLIAF